MDAADPGFVDHSIVIFGPIAWLAPFDAVLSALLAEYEGHRLSSSGSLAKSTAIWRASSIVMMPVCPAASGVRP